jgi:spore coat protein CotF
MIEKMKAQGIVLPPPSEEMMKLKQTAEKIVGEMEKTSDPAVKAELEKKLQAVEEKAKALQGGGGPMMIKKTALPPIEEIKAKLESLKQKETGLRAELEKTDSAEKKAELKKNLQMVLEKQEQLKIMAVEAQAKEAKAGK